jgi:imidazolonepropionase-like amidohydrolase
MLAALGFGVPAPAAERWQIVHAGTLVAVPGEPAREAHSILVRAGTITGIRAGYAAPAEFADGDAAEVIDLRDEYVLPGLIDAHVHLLVELGPDYKLERVTRTDADKALSGAQYARRTLEAGFTTVRDLASEGPATFALRDAIAAGKVPGPRILAAGTAIWATGHHAGFRPEILALMDTTTDCSGRIDCRRAVRAAVGRGADVIKVHATGAVLNETGSGLGQQLTEAELREIAVTAHGLGRRVAAHAHSAAGINAALRAGVDSIEHGTFLDAESLRLFQSSGAYLVPTLLAGEGVAARMNDAATPEPIRRKAAEVGAHLVDALRRAHAAGVKIAFGTDSGVTPHGENAREFERMVAAGMTPEEAIAAATIGAADLLGLGSELGTLAPGKRADVIATRDDPRKDVAALRQVRFVMQGGRVVRDDRPR